jgi:glucan phosphoethanolaminetransferase (alkaline phosphatase superfamily)
MQTRAFYASILWDLTEKRSGITVPKTFFGKLTLFWIGLFLFIIGLYFYYKYTNQGFTAADLSFRVSPPLAAIGFLLSAAGLYEERGKNKIIPFVVLVISFIMLCQAGYHFIHVHTPPRRP